MRDASGGVQVFAGTGDARANANNDLVLGRPAKLQPDDHIYLHVAVYAERSAQTIATPAGFVLVARQNTDPLIHTSVFHRLADGTEPATWSVVWDVRSGGGRLGMGRAYAVRGHKTGDSIGTMPVGSGTEIAAGSVTTVGRGTKTALLFGAQRVDGDSTPVIGGYAGETPAAYTRLHTWDSAGTTVAGRRAVLTLDIAPMASPTTQSGGVATSSIRGEWATVLLVAGSDTDIGTEPPAITFDKEFDVETPPYNAAASDRKAIQSMFDDIEAHSAAHPNDTICARFRAGKTYRVDRRLRLSGVRHLTILSVQGDRATIARDEAFDVSGSGRSQMIEITNMVDFTLQDMIFDGRRDVIRHRGSFGHLFVIRGGDQLEVRRCDFKRSQAVGLKIGPTPGARPVRPDAVTANLRCEDCLFTGNAKQGVTSDYCRKARYVHCTFEETGARFGDAGIAPSAGIDLEPQSRHGVNPAVARAANDDICFVKCNFRNNDGTGLQIGGDDGLNRNIEVDTCTFDNNGLDSPTPVRGALWIRNASPVPKHNIKVHDCDFIGQKTPPLSGHSKSVIYIHDFGDPSVLIEGNEFSGNSGAAVLIAMRNREGSSLITIRGNSMNVSTGLQTGSSPSDSNGPAAVTVRWSNVVVEGNTFIGKKRGANAPRGVTVEKKGAATPSRARITGNKFSAFSSPAIHILRGAGTIETTDNSFANCEPPTILDES